MVRSAFSSRSVQRVRCSAVKDVVGRPRSECKEGGAKLIVGFGEKPVAVIRA